MHACNQASRKIICINTHTITIFCVFGDYIIYCDHISMYACIYVCMYVCIKLACIHARIAFYVCYLTVLPFLIHPSTSIYKSSMSNQKPHPFPFLFPFLTYIYIMLYVIN